MINFPILKNLHVSGYGLYPGRAGDDGLVVEFAPGLTLVLGTNGLGKSTLVSILFRLLAGPFDIPGLKERTQLGNVELEATLVRPRVRSMFAQRVADNAVDAKARLVFDIGSTSLVVERRLRDLSLLRFSIDGKDTPSLDEQTFTDKIVELVGLWSFGDWILLLRHLTFYFEDRRALVWDPTAQRQLFRFLFLPPPIAKQWTVEERAILELDSRSRNLQSALNREERQLVIVESRVEGGESAREELRALTDLQRIDNERLDALELSVGDFEAAREQARLRLFQMEEIREGRLREAEHTRLLAISARFPSRSDTARYLLAHLVTVNGCLACGNDAPTAAAEYSNRATRDHCVICDTPLDESVVVADPKLLDRSAASAYSALATADSELASARSAFTAAGSEYAARSRDIGALRAATADRAARINALLGQLPPEEHAVHEQRSNLASFRSRVTEMKNELLARRAAFGEFVQTVNGDIVSFADTIKQAFDTFAEDFLFEQCRLVWAPQKDTVGETGQQVEYPAFGLEMTGGAFSSPVRRDGPDQVSESQREFIDLAFRMALMAVAGTNGSGSLVIDAPESSLDAVFTDRAANVLARFARRTTENRLIVTSNLIEGQLIPELLSEGMPVVEERTSRIVDLFEIAAPTAAVRELKAEYQEIRERILGTEAEGKTQ